MRVLVTGADGFVGRHLLKRLIRDGHTVIACTRRMRVPKPGLPIQCVQIDLLSQDELASHPGHFENVDALVHLASIMPTDEGMDGSQYMRGNHDFTVSLIEFLAEHVSHRLPIVYLSSIGVVGNSPDLKDAEKVDESTAVAKDLHPYFRSKLAAEHALAGIRNDQLAPVIFRLTSPYGSTMPVRSVLPSFVDRARRGERISWHGSGNRSQDFIFVDDVAQICVRAIETPLDPGDPCLFNLASGENTSMKKLAAQVCEIYPVAAGPSGQSDAQEGKTWGVDNARLLRTFGLPRLTTLEDGLKAYATSLDDAECHRELIWWED